MMEFEKNKFVIVSACTDYRRSFYKYAPPGVYRLYFRLCCDNFQTCAHAGKAAQLGRVKIRAAQNGWPADYRQWFAVDSIYPQAFDTKEQAELVRRLTQ